MTDTTPVCPFGTCDGSGKIRVGERTDAFCKCYLVRRIRSKFTPELLQAGTIRTSPLGDNTSPIRTGDSLLLRGTTEDFELPHVRLALYCKMVRDLNFRYTVVDDERLKNVWVGNESYGKRSKSKRDEIDTTNGLRDLLGEDFDLVIIKLGVIEAKNVEMPRILKEALLLRAALRKGVWLVEKPNRPFESTSGYRSFDDNVSYYIEQRFEIVELTNEGVSTETAPRKPQAKQVELDDESSFFAPDPTPKPPPKPPATPKSKSTNQQSSLAPDNVYIPEVMRGDLDDERKKGGWRR